MGQVAESQPENAFCPTDVRFAGHVDSWGGAASRAPTTIMKPWIILLVAALLEIVWAIGLKYTQGFTRLWPSVATIVTMAASMYLLATAARALPIGTAYAVWTGIGAVGTAAIGIIVLGEPAGVGRLICIALIVCGVAGLKVFSA